MLFSELEDLIVPLPYNSKPSYNNISNISRGIQQIRWISKANPHTQPIHPLFAACDLALLDFLACPCYFLVICNLQSDRRFPLTGKRASAIYKSPPPPPPTRAPTCMYSFAAHTWVAIFLSRPQPTF